MSCTIALSVLNFTISSRNRIGKAEVSRRLPKEAPKVQENIDPHVNIIIERSAGAEQEKAEGTYTWIPEKQGNVSDSSY